MAPTWRGKLPRWTEMGQGCAPGTALQPRMPSLLVNIDVDDLERARRFYTQAFDFHVSRRLGPLVLELSGAEAPIYLLQKSAGSTPHRGARALRHYARHW